MNDIVDRVQAFQKSEPDMKAGAEALLGTVDLTVHSVRQAFNLYFNHIAISDLAGKSDAQKRNWRKVKQRAVNNFVALCGDLQMDQISRKHGQEFRQWLAKRLQPKDASAGLNLNSANRDIGNMRGLFEAYWRYQGEETRDHPFRSLRFTE